MKHKLKNIVKTYPIFPTLVSRFGLGGPRFKALGDLPKNAIGAEIGVHLGDFSHYMLDIAKPKRLYLIDPWKVFDSDDYSDSWYGNKVTQEIMDERYQHVCNRFRNKIKRGQVQVIREESVKGLGGLTDESLDFVYIDGDHSYEGVAKDLELSLQKIKSGGLITGDDYGPGNWWEGGIKRAVDEFGWHDSVKLLWIEGTQFVLQKR